MRISSCLIAKCYLRLNTVKCHFNAVFSTAFLSKILHYNGIFSKKLASRKNVIKFRVWELNKTGKLTVLNENCPNKSSLLVSAYVFSENSALKWYFFNFFQANFPQKYCIKMALDCKSRLVKSHQIRCNSTSMFVIVL